MHFGAGAKTPGHTEHTGQARSHVVGDDMIRAQGVLRDLDGFLVRRDSLVPAILAGQCNPVVVQHGGEALVGHRETTQRVDRTRQSFPCLSRVTPGIHDLAAQLALDQRGIEAARRELLDTVVSLNQQGPRFSIAARALQQFAAIAQQLHRLQILAGCGAIDIQRALVGIQCLLEASQRGID